MARITFIGRDGMEKVLDLENGQTVMEGARQHGVEGIEAICGGECICGTCHVHVDELWLAMVGQRADSEDDLLGTIENETPQSRLSCQIVVSEELDGLVLRVPKA